MLNSNKHQIGLLRVIDAIQIISAPGEHQHQQQQISSISDPQRSVDFQEAEYTTVTTSDVIAAALKALHPDKPVTHNNEQNNNSNNEISSPTKNNKNNNNKKGNWIILPQIFVSDETGSSGNALPARASLLAAGLRPSAGVASEVYLMGKFQLSSSQTNISANQQNQQQQQELLEISDIQQQQLENGEYAASFVPSVVEVTLWSVAEKPVYNIDCRRPISNLTCGKMKKIIHKFSGIPIEEMDLDVFDNLTIRDDNAKLFPFIFDPSFVPKVRIRSKLIFGRGEKKSDDDQNVVASGNNVDDSGITPEEDEEYARSGRIILTAKNSDRFTQERVQEFAYLSHQRQQHQQRRDFDFSSSNSSGGMFMSPNTGARVEAEYGASFPLDLMNNNNTNNEKQKQQNSLHHQHTSPVPLRKHNSKNALHQVAPEESRDWSLWLQQRKQAREFHVKSCLVPSSKEQIMIERALQSTSVEDVKTFSSSSTIPATNQNNNSIFCCPDSLASSSQILHSQLEQVREDILRERLGDQKFAKIEGARAVVGTNGDPVLTSESGDGVDKEPLVVSFR